MYSAIQVLEFVLHLLYKSMENLESVDKVKKLKGTKCDVPSAENYRNVPKSTSCHNFLVAELITTTIYF
jgi:hypothetical protein